MSNLNEQKQSTLAALLGAGYPPGLGLDDFRLHAATGFGNAAAVRQARYLGKFPLPTTKLGKRVVVPLPALAAWLDQVSGLFAPQAQPVEAQSPTPQPAQRRRPGRPRKAASPSVQRGAA